MTQWTIAQHAPLSMDSPGKNTGVGCHALLQGIFLTQGSNLCLLYLPHWQAGSLPLAPTSFLKNEKKEPEKFIRTSNKEIMKNKEKLDSGDL